VSIGTDKKKKKKEKCMPGVDVARVLRSARDLMNTNGRHWCKGDLRLEITESLLEYQNKSGGLSISPKAQVGDVAYCAWGGISEVADTGELRVEAMEALVQIIDENSFNYYLDYMSEVEDEYHMEWDYSGPGGNFRNYSPTFLHYWDTRLDSREETLGDIIATWNDDGQRTWADVRDSLTKAAERAKAKKTTVF
jgi:hypothetical protein